MIKNDWLRDQMNLNKWRKDWKLMSIFFSGKEIALITDKVKNLKINHVALCSFENRFAKSGGLSSVVSNILPYLKEVNNIPSSILLTPFYPEIIDRSKLKSTNKKFSVSFMNKSVLVELLEYSWRYTKPRRGVLKEYYLKAGGFFSTSKNVKDPYVYFENDTYQNNRMLTDNALFFCKAVPHALKALNIREDVILHLHEWQTSLISLTSKQAMLRGTLKSCGTVQTMHNSYDSPLTWKQLTFLLEKNRKKKLTGSPLEGLSVYQIGLQLVDAPVTTVSENFARELTGDTLQTKHFVPHLQNILKTNTPFGINNGMFVNFSPEFPKRERHTTREIRKIKLKKRKALLQFLQTYKPGRSFGDLTYKGKSITKLPENIPVIIMSGRLDPLQKGYYVLLRALERFREDEIKAILIPLPVKKSDLDYFYEVACKCRGNITVFPLRMIKGYPLLQTGSTFGIMPSIYEPFGAAVEYMANGTINIGRATGGLVDQIDRKCGFLFKENAVFYTPENVKAFVDSNDIIQIRKANPWMQNMADSLYEVMRKAADIYRNQPDRYYRLILNGFRKAKEFTWESSARKYYDVYKLTMKA